MDAASEVSDLTLLIFEVDGHRYALHASDVQESIRAAWPARLAQAPDVIEGMLSIRGRMAAVLAMRLRFGLPPDFLHTPARTLANLRDVGPTALFARSVVALRAPSPHASVSSGAAL